MSKWTLEILDFWVIVGEFVCNSKHCTDTKVLLGDILLDNADELRDKGTLSDKGSMNTYFAGNFLLDILYHTWI